MSRTHDLIEMLEAACANEEHDLIAQIEAELDLAAEVEAEFAAAQAMPRYERINGVQRLVDDETAEQLSLQYSFNAL